MSRTCSSNRLETLAMASFGGVSRKKNGSTIRWSSGAKWWHRLGKRKCCQFWIPKRFQFFHFCGQNDSLTEPTIGKRPDHVRQAEWKHFFFSAGCRICRIHMSKEDCRKRGTQVIGKWHGQKKLPDPPRNWSLTSEIVGKRHHQSFVAKPILNRPRPTQK